MRNPLFWSSDPVIFLYDLLSIPRLDFTRVLEAVIKLPLVDRSLHFTSARSRSTAAAIAAERVAGGRRDAHHVSSRLSRSGLIVTEITIAAAPRRLPTVARVDLVPRAMADSMLTPSYTYLYEAINANTDKHIARLGILKEDA